MALLNPIAGRDWNRGTARHLLNRAGFGAPGSWVESLAGMSPELSVDHFLREPPPAKLEPPEFVIDDEDLREQTRGQAQLDPDERRKQRQERMREQRAAMNVLRVWWLRRMARSADPLAEKMALFWHGHFATSDSKVKSARANFEIYRVFRLHGLGFFPELVTAVSQSPAMLLYLDNNRNRRRSPNENFARELMELFTLGIGQYTEQDVHEAARAFTGWTVRGGRFVDERRQHDGGMKTLLGQSGDLDGRDAIRIICRQPALARFIGGKIWEFFGYENPSEYLVGELAAEFIRQKYQLRPFLKTVLLSNEFYSERARHKQIKSPVQLLVQLLIQLQIDPALARGKLLETALRGMGQELFRPPNVKGWEGNRAWINTNTLLARYNLPAMLLRARAEFQQPEREGAMTGDGEQPNADMAGGDLMAGDEMMAGDKHMPGDPVSGRAAADITAIAPVFTRRRDAGETAANDNRHNRRLFDAAQFFARFQGRTAGETVDGLLDHFLGRPVEAEQRRLLIRSIDPHGDERRVVDRQMIHAKILNGTVQLILSMAEYQLC